MKAFLFAALLCFVFGAVAAMVIPASSASHMRCREVKPLPILVCG